MAAESSSSTAGRSSGGGGGGGATADSYIGSLISLTSKSEIRYEGILYNINTDESSIGLRNVRSFGTEGRKKDGPQVPASDKVYEYILFRGSDIKDLQVKSSPPVQTTPPSINSDPAIIQSHYPLPATTSAPLPPPGPPLASAPLPDIGSHSTQPGHPGSTFQGGLPLYQPGGNLSSWGPSPPNAMPPMYWQGFYGAPGLPQMQPQLHQQAQSHQQPQLHQQQIHQQSQFQSQMHQQPPPSLLRPPPSMQPMQFSSFNPSLPTGASILQGSSLPDYPLPSASSSLNTASLPGSTVPSSTLPLGLPSMQPINFGSAATLIPSSAGMPSLSPLTSSAVELSSVTPSVPSKPTPVAPPVLQHQNISQPLTSVASTPSSVLVETPTPSLITPGQLLQSGPSSVSLNQSSVASQKDVEVVQVSKAPPPEALAPAPVSTEAQPPILPLPTPAPAPTRAHGQANHNHARNHAHRPNGAQYHMRNNYRGRGGRGAPMARPVTKFAEDFDFEAMNEKFKKDEVWGHLGKSKKDKDVDDGNSDEDDYDEEYEAELPPVDVNPIYNKDDFFDSLSSNAGDNKPNHGRNNRAKFSELMKLDTETFGEFSRYRGGRGGRGPYRGGGRSRGYYGGRGYGGGGGGGGGGGYGYASRGRGRGRGVPNSNF